jgi:nucleoside-diphosphate-sugar epimerase
MKKTFLITGGTGFIGSFISKKLASLNENVIIYDLFPNYTTIKDIIDKVIVIRGDILDKDKLISIIKDYHVDYIIHLASLLTNDSRTNPRQAIRVNCEGTNVIFECAREIENIKRVIWASSMAVYGPQEWYFQQPVNEDAPLRPTTLYGACKAFNEYMAQIYATEYGIDIIGLRPSLVYGPGKSSGLSGTIYDLLVNVLAGKQFKFPKPWHRRLQRDWIYIKDVVNAFLLASNIREVRHRIFNLCSGQLVSLEEVINYVRELIPGALIEFDEEPSWYPNAPLCDNTRIREELGFKLQYTLREGLKETIDLIRKELGL